MTRAEWVQLEAFIAANFQQARVRSADEIRLRYPVVAELDHDETLATLVRMVRADGKWPPNTGELYAAVTKAQRPPMPSTGEVIRLMRLAAGKFGRDREAQALRWLHDQSPHAARAAYEHGWREWCMERSDDPEYGGAVRQRIERSVGASAAGLEREYRDGQVRELVGPRIRQLEAGAAGPPTGLRRLDAGSVLPDRPQLDAGAPA